MFLDFHINFNKSMFYHRYWFLNLLMWKLIPLTTAWSVQCRLLYKISHESTISNNPLRRTGFEGFPLWEKGRETRIITWGGPPLKTVCYLEPWPLTMRFKLFQTNQFPDPDRPTASPSLGQRYTVMNYNRQLGSRNAVCPRARKRSKPSAASFI